MRRYEKIRGGHEVEEVAMDRVDRNE